MNFVVFAFDIFYKNKRKIRFRKLQQLRDMKNFWKFKTVYNIMLILNIHILIN